MIYGRGENGENTLYLAFEEGKNARYSVFVGTIYYICAEIVEIVEKCKNCAKKVLTWGKICDIMGEV